MSGSINLSEDVHDTYIDYFVYIGSQSMAVTVSDHGIEGTQDIFASGLVANPNDSFSLVEGNDILRGGAEDDTLYGYSGDDILEGDASGKGLNYEFYNLNSPTSVTDGGGFVVGNFDILGLAAKHGTNPEGTNDPGDIGIHYTGEIAITTAGSYTLYTNSDDGSTLPINGIQVVDNDSNHGDRERPGIIYLSAGTHDIEVKHFKGYALNVLGANVSDPDTGNVKTELFIRHHHLGSGRLWRVWQ